MVREPLINSMDGTDRPKMINYFVAKLENIPDIHCILRLVLAHFRSIVAYTDVGKGHELGAVSFAHPGIKQKFLSGPS